MLKGKQHHGKEGGGGERSRWNLIGREYESESLIQLPGFGATGLFWAVVTRVCVYVCGCVHVRMYTSVHRAQSNSWSHQILVVGLATACMCVCWRKMKVVWRPNHNTEARFKRRYLSSLTPSLKSPLLHHQSVNHSSSSIRFYFTHKLCLYGLFSIDSQDNSQVCLWFAEFRA